MAPRDAFGRSSDEPDPVSAFRATPVPDPDRKQPPTARPVGRGPAPKPRSGRGAAALRFLATLLLLAVGGVAIGATMSRAVDRARDDQRVADHALAKDPLGPRSYLRTAALRRALQRLRDAAEPDERLAHLSVSPERVLATLVDAQDQQRWLSIGSTGKPRSIDLSSTASGDPGAPLSILSAIDPAPATRFLARKYRQLQPHAREPTMLLSITGLPRSSTTSSSAGARAGIPQATKGKVRHRYRWSISFRGVRQDDSSWLLRLDGKPER